MVIRHKRIRYKSKYKYKYNRQYTTRYKADGIEIKAHRSMWLTLTAGWSREQCNGRLRWAHGIFHEQHDSQASRPADPPTDPHTAPLTLVMSATVGLPSHILPHPVNVKHHLSVGLSPNVVCLSVVWWNGRFTAKHRPAMSATTYNVYVSVRCV